MGLSHKRFPLHGIQFHPESFLTELGAQLVNNFLNRGGTFVIEPLSTVSSITTPSGKQTYG